MEISQRKSLFAQKPYNWWMICLKADGHIVHFMLCNYLATENPFLFDFFCRRRKTQYAKSKKKRKEKCEETRMRKYKPVMLQTRSSLFLLSFYFRAAHSVINVILLSEKDTWQRVYVTCLLYMKCNAISRFMQTRQLNWVHIADICVYKMRTHRLIFWNDFDNGACR